MYKKNNKIYIDIIVNELGMKKAQAALEFLTTYGWAFIVILVLISAMSVFGVFDNVGVDKCVAGQGFTCESTMITDTTQKFKFKNTLGTEISISNASAKIKSTDTSVNCTSPSNQIQDGETFEITCSAQGLKSGKKENLDIQFNYYSASGTSQYSKPVYVDLTGTVQDNSEYQSSSGGEGTTTCTANATSFEAGSGSTLDPYEICNYDQLKLATNYSSNSFILINDIDASSSASENSGQGFIPIGTSGQKYSGTFDGANHTISGLTITRTQDYQGLFGAISSGATVKNLRITGASITGSGSYFGLLAGQSSGAITNVISEGTVEGSDYSGGLIGSTEGATVTDCSTSGSIIGAETAGGLIGNAESTTISNSFSTASVQTYSGNTGGLLGHSYAGSITDSYATGQVNSGGEAAGGLVGSSSTTITKAYATGNVIITSGDMAGGLIGSNTGAVSKSYATGQVTGSDFSSSLGGLIGFSMGGTITNSYAQGNVVGGTYSSRVGGLIGGATLGATITKTYSKGTVSGSSNLGGLIGWKYATATVSSSYYDSTTSGMSDTGKGEPKTTTEMKQQTTYSGWDFSTIWNIDEAQTYPYLR